MDVSDVVKKEFTSKDYDRYMAQLAPYGNKVRAGKELLSDNDVRELEGIKEEFTSTYDNRSLVEYRIIGEIYHLLSMNENRVISARETALDQEHTALSKEYDLKRLAGTLTSEDEVRIFARCNEIGRILYPEYRK